jgi:hypothetical protein
VGEETPDFSKDGIDREGRLGASFQIICIEWVLACAENGRSPFWDICSRLTTTTILHPMLLRSNMYLTIVNMPRQRNV